MFNETIVPYINDRGNRPMVFVNIGRYGYTRPILALIDYGADYTLFPFEYGESLNIDFTEARIEIREVSQAFETISQKVYVTSEEMELVDCGIKVSSEIHWVEKLRIPLLGRKGFFDRFDEVVFNENNKKVTLKKLK